MFIKRKIAATLCTVGLMGLLPAQAQADCENRGFNSFEDRVMGAYLAYYGRPADPGGLEYWAGRLEDEGGNLNSIMDAFANSEEFDRRFGSLSNTDLVNNVFLQLFGRDADTGGLDFYVGSLEARDRTLQTIAVNVLDGAQNKDADIIDNRLSLSSSYVTLAELTNFSGSESELADMAESVGDSSFSRDEACDTLQTSVNAHLETNGTAIAGRVIDPEIADAIVCLDYNGDLSCGPGEPSTTTDDLGAFVFMVTEEPPAGTNVIIENAGSFDDPAYGYHNGIPFDLQMFAPVEGLNGEEILVTPLSTMMETFSLDAGNMAEVLNQFSSDLGALVDAQDMERDPLEYTSGVAAPALTEADLRLIRANIVAYAVSKVLIEAQDIDGFDDFASSFMEAATDPSHPVFTAIELMTGEITDTVDLSMLDPVNALIQGGNNQLQTVGLTPLPTISADLVIDVAIPFVDYLTDKGVQIARDELAENSFEDFESAFSHIIDLV